MVKKRKPKSKPKSALAQKRQQRLQQNLQQVEPLFYTRHQVAKALGGVSVQTVRRLEASGALKDGISHSIEEGQGAGIAPGRKRSPIRAGEVNQCVRRSSRAGSTPDYPQGDRARRTPSSTEYQAQGFRLTLRQLFYQFVSRELLANSKVSYRLVCNVMDAARNAGEVDWDAIEDRTRIMHELGYDASPEDAIEYAAQALPARMCGLINHTTSKSGS